MQFVIVIFFFFRVQNAISAVWIIRPVVILMVEVRASCNAMNIIRWWNGETHTISILGPTIFVMTFVQRSFF